MVAGYVAQGIASGIIKSPASAPTFRLVGDSIASQNDQITKMASGGGTAQLSRYPRFWAWTQWLTGSNVNYQTMLDVALNQRVGSNSAYGGDDFEETLARIQQNIANWPETYIIINCGTNSLNAGKSLAEMKTGIVNILNYLDSCGKIPIVLTITPRNAVDGANDWSATITTAAQKRQILVAYNGWLKDYCREYNYRCADVYGRLVDDAGNAITGSTTDGVHPNGYGSYLMAQAVISALDGLIVPRRVGEKDTLNVYDATYNPNGNILNSAMTGTGGSVSTGATGTLPDNWQIVRQSGASTCVASIVNRPDGSPGKAIKLVFTSPGGGSAAREFRLNYWSGSTTSLVGFGAVGDLLSFESEVYVEDDGAGYLTFVQPRVGDSAALTSGARTTISFNAATNTINDSGGNFGTLLSGRYCTVSGSTLNNNVYLVTSKTNSVLTIDPSTPVVTEAAGASITITNQAGASVVGASVEKFPPSTNMGIIYMTTPIFQPLGGNLVPRFSIWLDDSKTIGETATMYIMNPNLYKMPFRPAVLSIVGEED